MQINSVKIETLHHFREWVFKHPVAPNKNNFIVRYHSRVMNDDTSGTETLTCSVCNAQSRENVEQAGEFTCAACSIPPTMASDQLSANHPPTDPTILALQRMLTPRMTPAPIFSGFDHEDPEVFVTRSQTHLETALVPPDQWAETAAAQLRGDAAKWYGQYQALSLTWAQFTERLTTLFGSATVLGKLTSQLYGKPQGEKEPADVFLLGKIQLLRRLFPAAEDVAFIPIFAGLLRPNTRRIIRVVQPTTFEALLEQASQLEEDEAAARPPQQRPPQQPRSNGAQPGAPQGAPNSRRPPQCWHCPNAFHFHRDCPTLAQQSNQGNSGNGRGATDNATAAARQ